MSLAVLINNNKMLKFHIIVFAVFEYGDRCGAI